MIITKADRKAEGRMDDMAFNHDNEMPSNNDMSPDKPGTVDSERSPQLNKVVCRCRCGCACASSRGGENGDSGGGGQAFELPNFALPESADDNVSEDGSSSVNGEEGVDHEVEVGDLGLVSMRTIFDALAKHRRCTCHGGVLPDSEDYPFTAFNSPAVSGMSPTDSMIVQLGGNDRSMSSLSLLSARSGSTQSSARAMGSPGFLVGHTGGQFDHLELAHSVSPHFVRTPLLLTQEDTLFGMAHDVHYPTELSIGDGESRGHIEYDT